VIGEVQGVGLGHKSGWLGVGWGCLERFLFRFARWFVSSPERLRVNGSYSYRVLVVFPGSAMGPKPSLKRKSGTGPAAGVN
jgi:hypothetical protein